MILATIFFLLFIFFLVIIPATILMQILHLDEQEFYSKLGLQIGLGIIFLTLSIFITRYLGLGFWLVWPIFIGSVWYIWKNKKQTDQKYSVSLLISIAILTGMIAQNIVLFRGGWQLSSGISFPSTHDTMWNIALANELYYRFPPEHPGMAGELLKNNHYFYPLFLAISRFVTRINIQDLYFRLGPPLVSLLFGLSLYAFSTLITKNRNYRALIIFLGYFSGNISYLMPFILRKPFDWQGNTFFSDQPFDQIINPYSVLGFSFFLLGIYSLFKATQKQEKLDLGWSIVSGIFFGALYGFKSFGGIIAVISLTFTSVYYVLRYKKINFLIIPVFTFLIFLPIFFFTTEPRIASMRWAPGWLLTEMMVSQDKLNLPVFADMENYYRSIGNLLGLLKIKSFEFVIYALGNLGIRIVGFIYLCKLLFFPEKNTHLNHIGLTFIFIACLTAFSIPLLFNLGGNAYNIVQFTPYALFLFAIFTGAFLERTRIYFKKRQNNFGIVLVTMIVLMLIPVNIKNIFSKLEISGDLIDKEEMLALQYLSNNTTINSVVLLDPRQFRYDPIYVSALSQRRIYLASPDYSRQTGRNPSERLQKVYNIFDGTINEQAKSFFVGNSIAYIYIEKQPVRDKFLKQLFSTYGTTAFFENERIMIYQVAPTK